MGRSPCCDESGLKKGPWTPEEDEKLVEFIHKNGHGSWRALPKLAGLNRCGKSCRLRWTNYLRPGIKRGEFSEGEDESIIQLHSVLGNKWSRIAAQLSGRTDNEIKNYWNTHLRKKLLQRGIDPKTHKPITDLNLLANLSQLLSSRNFGIFMNPWDNALIKSQVDATTHLARIQIVQSIMQVMNITPFANLTESNFLSDPHINIAQIGGLLNGTCRTSTFYNTSDQIPPPRAPFDFPSLSENAKLFDTYQTVTNNSMGYSEDGFQPELVGVNYSCLNSDSSTDQTEKRLLPPLVSDLGDIMSPRGRKLQDRKIHNSNFPFTHSANSNLLEDWEKFLDDEASGDPWEDILV